MIRKTIGFLAFFFLIALSGCAVGIPQAMRQSLTVVIPHEVDFVELEFYGKRARATYMGAAEIKKQFPQTTRVATVEKIDVLYFVETDHTRKRQIISVRGTSSKQNFWQDVELALIDNSYLGIRLHRGFDNDTVQVRDDLKPYLRNDYALSITGHSLGGAIAMILSGYLSKDGFDVETLVTFGQPKITNEAGASAYEGTKVVRVAHDNDVVPMIPPTAFLQAGLGGYEHIGPEIILRDGPEYVYLPKHDAERLSVGELWRNISHFSVKEHFMKAYLANIEDKVKNGTRQVPYFGLKRGKSTASSVPQ